MKFMDVYIQTRVEEPFKSSGFTARTSYRETFYVIEILGFNFNNELGPFNELFI